MTDDRELRLDRLQAQFDDCTVADVLDAATIHLEESIGNMETMAKEHPKTAKEAKTSIVRPRYRTWVELNKP